MTQIRDAQALWRQSPNFWAGRQGQKIRYIVIHATGGGGSLEWLTTPWYDKGPEASAHYLILEDGTIWQLVDENDSAWAQVLTAGHASFLDGTPMNLIAISIEFEKRDTTNRKEITAAQRVAGFALIDRICTRWNIPRRAADATGGILHHSAIDPGNRSGCPGPFPDTDLYAYLAHTTLQGDDETMNVTIGQGIGSHFEDRGNGKWYCKTTKVEFWGGNLAFWRSYGGLGGLPLTGEIKLSPNSAAVVCERWIQIYDPNREVDHPYETGNVYLLHIDGGKGQALIAKNLTDALNAQIAGLQQQITALKAQVAAGIPADYQATKDQLAQTSARLQLYVQSVKLVQSTLQKL